MLLLGYFITQNVHMGRVRVSWRWLKCADTEVKMQFFCEIFLPFCFILSGSKFIPGLYNFPDTHTILMVTPPMETPPCLACYLNGTSTEETSACCLP